MAKNGLFLAILRNLFYPFENLPAGSRFQASFSYLFNPGLKNRGILALNQDLCKFLRISVTIFVLRLLYY